MVANIVIYSLNFDLNISVLEFVMMFHIRRLSALKYVAYRFVDNFKLSKALWDKQTLFT